MKNFCLYIFFFFIVSGCAGNEVNNHSSGKQKFKYRLIRPDKAEGEIKAVIFLLHGYGSNSDDLLFVKNILPAGFTIVSIEAPHKLSMGSYAWFDVKFTDGKVTSVDTVEAENVLTDLSEFIPQVINDIGANNKPVYILGFSQGAHIAIELYLSNPNPGFNVAALSGMISPKYFNSEIPCRGLLFAGHGEYDTVIPVSVGREIRDLFRNCDKFTYHEYKMTHTINEEELNDLYLWFRIKR